MKNKFSIPIINGNFKKFPPFTNNYIDKFTLNGGNYLDYTRNINRNFSKLYFGFRLRIKRK